MFTEECLLSARYSITGFVCVTVCVYTRVCVCEAEGVCACLVICVLQTVCERVTGLYQSHRICSLPSSLSVSRLILTPALLHFFFFFWEVVQSKSKPVLSTVYWSCDTAQINIFVLFTKQTHSYTILALEPPSPVKRPGLGGGREEEEVVEEEEEEEGGWLW